MTSIVRQVTRATLLVASFAVLVLAIAAALTSRFVFESQEEGIIRRSALALAEAMRHELVEERLPLSHVAEDSIRESGLADDVIEVWTGDVRIATNRPTETIGRGPSGVAVKSAAWLAITVPVIPDVSLVVAAPRDRGQRASRIFMWSLAVAAPLALLAALFVGRKVARRVTGPLIALRDRFERAGPLEPVGPGEPSDPVEVRDMDTAFREQRQRVRESFDREHDFAANAAHELRTPLTRLRLLAERIRGDDAQTPRLVAQQMDELMRMSKLVDALLVLARSSDAGVPLTEAVNLADLVRGGVLEVFGSASAPDLHLPDEAMVRGDEDLLRVAAVNLLDNARKFGAAGGRSTVEVGVLGGRIHLKVTTSGARIDGPAKARLFDRFYRSPEARAETLGHGLGLSLARHIALMHGGDLTLASGDDEDAMFLLELPAWQPE